MRTFRREPYELLHAYDAAEAWKIIEDGTRVTVIISDQCMEGTYGLDLLKQVRNRFPEILTILLTGHADLRLVIQAINEGHVHRFFTKPWEPDELRRDVRRMIECGPDAPADCAGTQDMERKMAELMLPKRDEATGAFIIDAPE